MANCSSAFRDIKKKKSQVSPKKIKGNKTKISAELVLFFHIWL
jgi:hypothetical protein